MTKYCRVQGCGVELTDENWSPSRRRKGECICKKCHSEQTRLWRKENPDKARAIDIRHSRKRGALPMSENRGCAAFLGIHVAEMLMRNVFKDVEVMPHNNPGYDFKCNRDKLIDVKSSCINKDGGWKFTIRHNTIADFFVCVAFDNREDLNVLHVWMIPGEKLNHLMNASIRPSTVHKWDQYKLDIDKVSSCCNEMKDAARGGE